VTSIERYEEPLSEVVNTYGRIIAQVSRTDFVPRSFKGNEPAILACMLYGREIGLQPMQSLRMIDSIQGTPTLKPEAMRALVRQMGHRIWFDKKDYTERSVTIHGQRKEDPEDMVVTVTFTWADGERAKLTNKDSWKHYPRSMLAARATAELCRLHFADAIGGLSYTPEEAEEFDPPERVTTVVPLTSTSHDEPATITHEQFNEARAKLQPGPATTRKPPAAKVPEGMVSPAEAKERLLNVYLEAGYPATDARSYAKLHWSTWGLEPNRSEPLTVDKVESMIDDAVELCQKAADDALPEQVDADVATGEIVE
jgi:hypothetical protein